jgi:hypothetical protein
MSSELAKKIAEATEKHIDQYDEGCLIDTDSEAYKGFLALIDSHLKDVREGMEPFAKIEPILLKNHPTLCPEYVVIGIEGLEITLGDCRPITDVYESLEVKE